MIGLLHGYLLEGSGSNVWTRSILRALCRRGETVHLVCQEPHPADYDFIAEAHLHAPDGTVETLFRRPVPFAGRCIMHKPRLGDTLPVYVRDDYEEFPNVVPMVELADDAIEAYVAQNARVVRRVVKRHGVTALHANHAVLMSVVAQRVAAATGVPYAVMPHGSALEYAVKPDSRFLAMARAAFADAARIFVVGPEMRDRVRQMFADVDGIGARLATLNLGADTSLFEPVPPQGRYDLIKRLERRLMGLPRGRRPEQTTAMSERLDGGMDRARLMQACDAARGYDAKLTDAGAEARLLAIDWAGARTLLFVGRLIAAKGPQSVIAALPLLFAREPALHAIVVGHGPLREPLEALVWALGRGERGLAERIVGWGTALEGGPLRPFGEVTAFFERLAADGRLDGYFELARAHLVPERVVFTGYLSHDELRFLYPCCDVAVFPSIVREAGPLVFLEAMAAGCFPMGTYFGGMAASIDAVAPGLPDGDGALMRIDADEARTVADIVAQLPPALAAAPRHRERLHEIAVRLYDWRSVADSLARELAAMGR